MRLFIGDEEFSSVEEYGDAIMACASADEKRHIFIHAYASAEDRTRMVNAVGGFVPYKPYSSTQVCNGVKQLEQYLSV